MQPSFDEPGRRVRRSLDFAHPLPGSTHHAKPKPVGTGGFASL